MRKTIAVLAALTLVACSRDKTYEEGGALDTTADTTAGVDVDVGLKKDSMTVPVIETKKDTLIVDKPVGVGTKKVEVKRPTVDVNKKP